MTYYLYSKTIHPNIKEIIKPGVKVSKLYPAITILAKLKQGKCNCIHYSLDKWAEKYTDSLTWRNWELMTRQMKMDKFLEFVSLNQETEDCNNFGIINANGVLWEPTEFIEYVQNFNRGTK